MNATALAQDSEAITDGTLGAMKDFRDEFCSLVSCHREQNPVVIVAPRLSRTQSVFSYGLSNKSEFGGPATNRVRLPAGMPSKKCAHGCSLSVPPFLITFSEDLVVFWSPGCALIRFPT